MNVNRLGPIILLASGFIGSTLSIITGDVPVGLFGGTMIICSWLWTICNVIEKGGKSL